MMIDVKNWDGGKNISKINYWTTKKSTLWNRKKSASNRKDTSCCIYTENSTPQKWSLHYIVKNYDDEKKVPKMNFDLF